MYCKICHKRKPDNHFDLYPDHAVARKRPLYLGDEGEEEEAPARPRQAYTPRQRASESDQGEDGESKVATWTLIGIGGAVAGFIGWAIWQGWRNGAA